MAAWQEIDRASPLQFVVNAAAGSSDAAAKRAIIETALRALERRGDLLFCSPAGLSAVAQQAATKALASRTADGETWVVEAARHHWKLNDGEEPSVKKLAHRHAA